MSDASDCPYHMVMERDISVNAEKIDDHEERIRVIEKSEKKMLLLIGLTTALFSTMGGLLGKLF